MDGFILASYGIGSSASVHKMHNASHTIISSLVGKLHLHMSGKTLKVVEV